MSEGQKEEEQRYVMEKINTRGMKKGEKYVMGTLKGCKRNNMTVKENKWQWQREIEWEERAIWKKYNKWNTKPSYLQPKIKLMALWQALWNCAVVQSSFIMTGALKPRNRTTNGVWFGQTHWPYTCYWPPRKSLFNRAMKQTKIN